MFSVMPDEICYAMARYMGSGQGDSSGGEGTSSDSDEEEMGGASGIVSKALKARARVLNLTSLKHLCLDVVINNNQMLANSKKQKLLFKRMGKNHGEVLDIVMQKMWPTVERTDSGVNYSFVSCTYASVEMLLHENLEEFNMNVLQREKDVEKMWTILPSKCPNLKKIVHQYTMQTKMPILPLLQFKKLETIIMTQYLCDETVLEKLARGFPKLKHLEMTFDRPSQRGLDHLCNMKQLEKLIYRVRCKPTASEQNKADLMKALFIKFVENLPQLKVCDNFVGRKVVLNLPGLKDCDQVIREVITPHLKQIYQRHKSDKFTLKLERIKLDKSLGIPPERLPGVKDVTITGSITCARELSTFTHLERLSMSVIAAKDAMCILKKLGSQLKYLKISNEYRYAWSGSGLETSEIVYDFFEIFSLCPNLEDLVFEGTRFCENPSISVSADNFKCLKKVVITMYDAQGYQMPLPIVEHILRAENLENLRLYWTRCLPKALFNVLNENNTNHFQKLKNLNLERIWVKNYLGYIKSLKRLIARAPLLQQLEIGCVSNGVEEFKKSGLKQLCQQIPGFKFLTDYDGDF